MGFSIPGTPISIGGGGGGKKGGAPPPPDYKGAAEATAVGNHPNQVSPWASSQWSQGPGGQWSQQVSLDPSLQGAASGFEQQLGMASGPEARNQVINALYGQQTSRLDPQWNQRQQSMNADLANQGLSPGDYAFNQQQGNFGRARNDAYTSALNSSILMGGQEQQRQLQMALGGLQGLQGLTGMPGAPPGANYLAAAGMAGQYGLGAQELNNQAQADYWKGLMGLGSAAILAA